MLTNVLFGGRLTDMETAYKVFRRDVMRSIRLRCVGFDFEPEVTARLLLAGHRIVEVPIGYVPRTADEGKKIGWVDGIDAIYVLLKCRFTARESRRTDGASRLRGLIPTSGRTLLQQVTNLHQERLFLGRRRRSRRDRFLPPCRVHRLHHQKQRERHDHEIDDEVDEEPDVEGDRPAAFTAATVVYGPGGTPSFDNRKRWRSRSRRSPGRQPA